MPAGVTLVVTMVAGVSTALAPANPTRRMLFITNNDPSFPAYVSFGTNNNALVGGHRIAPLQSLGIDNLLREGMGGLASAVNIYEGDVAVIMPQVTTSSPPVPQISFTET